ncbi:DUF2779 domain-containing protein [Schleiferiaceae bacterium]|nr:DUF2779 domain-containing protein [Schleiferiaceae bacterium]
MEELASGGFQVEALARTAYRNGQFIGNLHADDITVIIRKRKPGEVLELFEPTFVSSGCSSKVDILIVNDQGIHIKEVKAKSFDPTASDWLGKKNPTSLNSKYAEVLMDLAFQTDIISRLYPDVNVTSSFIMADKLKVASRDGMNQLFETDGGRILTQVSEELAWGLLTDFDVTDIVRRVLADELTYQKETFSFYLSNAKEVTKDIFPNFPPKQTACKNCEFRSSGIDSMHLICFHEFFDINSFDGKPTILDIGNNRNTSHFDSGKLLLEDIDENPYEEPINGKLLTLTNRQWLQFEMATNKQASSVYFDREMFRRISGEWEWPLNLIDFETSAVAIPFYKGQRPYENIAFQFSHHILHEDGRIEHADQFLNTTPGEFPNFQFARELIKSLSRNKGSVFRFATHENTIITHIIKQLRASNLKDKVDLINGLVPFVNGNKLEYESSLVGTRNMVDLLKVAESCYYSESLGGRYSMKKLLPAVFQSEFVKGKYQKEIGDINLSSLNFPKNWRWYQEGQDPYKLLPSYEVEDHRLDANTEINNGGLALAMYGKLQFTDVNEKAREEIRTGLLRYCELDTLAMAMVIEYFKSIK